MPWEPPVMMATRCFWPSLMARQLLAIAGSSGCGGIGMWVVRYKEF